VFTRGDPSTLGDVRLSGAETATLGGDDIIDLLVAHNVHSTHTRHFGLFTPSVTVAGVAGDLIAAMINPQLGAWWHAPAAVEIETRALELFCRRIGFDPSASYATFTSGGSESNLTAILCALSRHFPSYGEDGLASLERRPVFYASDEAHDSLVKVAHGTGLGRSALHRVRCNARGEMDLHHLAERIQRDRRAGLAPFLVAGTAGTTGFGAIDPLDELASLCAAEALWFHVDAAWGAIALLSDALRPHLLGIERAHSVTWDAHKTLPIPMGAGMVFLSEGRAAQAAFDVHTTYVPETKPGTADLYRRSVQWSRRFIGLKVFLTLAEQGESGVAHLVEHQSAIGALLREELASTGWTVVNDTPLPLVCCSHPSLRPDDVQDVVARVRNSGGGWVSEVRRGSERYVRVCITNYETGAEDIRTLVRALDAALV
jgi:aromatic-L-amino-acid decarboxylase